MEKVIRYVKLGNAEFVSSLVRHSVVRETQFERSI